MKQLTDRNVIDVHARRSFWFRIAEILVFWPVFLLWYLAGTVYVGWPLLVTFAFAFVAGPFLPEAAATAVFIGGLLLYVWHYFRVLKHPPPFTEFPWWRDAAFRLFGLAPKYVAKRP